jgi:DtxR family Mn-dependent transcriptional regulator
LRLPVRSGDAGLPRLLLCAQELPPGLLPAMLAELPAATTAAVRSAGRFLESLMEKMRREGLEDLLEAVWLRREAGKSFSPSRYRPKVAHQELPRLLQKLAEDGLLTIRDDLAELTPQGDEVAAQIVRRHRLAERLFNDLLSTEGEDTSSLACRFEHILNEEVTEAVCTLLGHPPTCPHGCRIPPGPCCRRALREVRPLIHPLSDCAPGSRLRIVFITPSVHQRLDRLNSMGVLPGEVIHLHQKQPSFVIRIGATEVAIEKDVAREIFVIKLD